MFPHPRINVDDPRWNLDTFSGRLKHFLWITDPRTAFVDTQQLIRAKELIKLYRRGDEPVNTTLTDIRKAQQLTLSAFHPDSGELQNVFGRMSFQVPGGMLLTGALLAFYKSVPAVIFWQWINQSFNALVNYTNRNAKSPVSLNQLGTAYISATISAVVVSLGLKNFLATRAPIFFQRFVPFAAVAAANVVNIPLMRQNELKHGIVCYDKNGKEVTKSKLAAITGISQVMTSRILIAMPGMVVTPFIMKHVDKIRIMQRYGKYLDAPVQTFFVGCFLLFMVPLGCSIFPQTCSISTSRLSLVDKEEYKHLREQYGANMPTTLYFNKGL